MGDSATTGTVPKTEYFDTKHLRSGLKTRALRGASLTMAGQLASFVIQMTGTIVLARLLTPKDFGLVTMVLSVSLLLQGFGGNGFIEAVVQKEEINHRQISTLFWINAGMSFMLMLLFMASAPIIAAFYKEPRLKPIVLVLAGTILFGGLSNQHVSILTRNMQFFRRTANEVNAAFISTAAAILLALAGWGYWALVMKWLLSPLLITVGAWMLCRWRPGLPARRAGVRPMLAYAFHTYGNFVMSYFRRNVDKMLVGRSFGSQSLGFYDRAYHLSNMLPVQIVSPLSSVSLAAFSRLTEEHERYRQSYLKVLAILAFVGMPLSAAMTLVAKDVILLLLGPQWNYAGVIFSAFGPSIGIAIIYITHGWLHLSLGTPDRWFRWSIVEFVVTVIGFLIGLQYGALGVAVAFSLSFYVLLGPALSYAGRPIGLTFRSVLSAIWKYYVAAFASAFLCWTVLHGSGEAAVHFRELPVLERIAGAGMLCMAVYAVLIVLLFRSIVPFTQFFTVVRDMLRKRSSE